MPPLTIAHLFDVSDRTTRRRAAPPRPRHAHLVERPDAVVDPPLVPVEDYAVLGDGKTAALVSLRGSIDWLCLPTFDSAACFARLLGTPDNGRWLLTVRDATTVTRRYLDDSFVLETTYETPDGHRRRAGDHAAQRRPRGPGAPARLHPRQRRGRARVGGAVRVRRRRAVGAAHHRRRRERRDPGDRRPGLAAAARRPAAHAGRPPARRPVHAAARASRSSWR